MYASCLLLLMADRLDYLPVRLIDEVDMKNARDWLSRLLEMIPLRGTLGYQCVLTVEKLLSPLV